MINGPTVMWYSIKEWYYRRNMLMFRDISRYFNDKKDINRANLKEYYDKMIEAEYDKDKAKIERFLR